MRSYLKFKHVTINFRNALILKSSKTYFFQRFNFAHRNSPTFKRKNFFIRINLLVLFTHIPSGIICCVFIYTHPIRDHLFSTYATFSEKLTFFNDTLRRCVYQGIRDLNFLRKLWVRTE